MAAEKESPQLVGVLVHPEGSEVGWMAWDLSDKKHPAPKTLIDTIQKITDQLKDEGFKTPPPPKPRRP